MRIVGIIIAGLVIIDVVLMLCWILFTKKGRELFTNRETVALELYTNILTRWQRFAYVLPDEQLNIFHEEDGTVRVVYPHYGKESQSEKCSEEEFEDLQDQFRFHHYIVQPINANSFVVCMPQKKPAN